MMRRKGFTLIELVVVILILGILAGVAAPKMFSTSTKASESGLRQSLSVVRDAIELYYSQNGQYPPCNAVDGSNLKSALQPFIRGPFPVCPVGPATGDSRIIGSPAALTADAAPTVGWRYSTGTGEFICNYDAMSTTVSGVKFNQF